MNIIILWVKHGGGATNGFPLTDPEVVEPLAHGATLVWDLVEVLVETWLERDEPRQGREVVFWETRARSVPAYKHPQ